MATLRPYLQIPQKQAQHLIGHARKVWMMHCETLGIGNARFSRKDADSSATPAAANGREANHKSQQIARVNFNVTVHAHLDSSKP